MQIRNRIRELRWVKASELLPNPKNWRRHPKKQTAALRALLNEIGYADALIARELPDCRLQLLDGHLRAETTPGALYTRFVAALEAAGFSFKHGLVWVKNQFVIGMSDYHYRHESVLYGWLENGPHYFLADRTQDSVFEIDKPHVSDLHPTCKPVELIARMVANRSRPGEVVYDPFAGSGSAILAAHQLGRIGYGCEIDPGYVAVTLERLTILGLTPELAAA
jgi:DNA modification methylase